MDGVVIPSGFFGRLIDHTIIAKVNNGVDKANAFRKEDNSEPYKRKNGREGNFRHNASVKR